MPKHVRPSSTSSQVVNDVGHYWPRLAAAEHPSACFLHVSNNPPSSARNVRSTSAPDTIQIRNALMDAPHCSLKYAPELPKGPYVVTGPVIGKVTSTKARVLIETSVDCRVTCVLTDRNNRQVSEQKTFQAHRPSAFQFTKLEPETKYDVSFNIPTPGLRRSRFRTIPNNWRLAERSAKFGFVSCNKYRITRDDVKPEYDLWKPLYKKASRGEIDYLLHMGDNVYADSDLYGIEEGTADPTADCRWAMALEMMKDVPREHWPDYFDRICEYCRSIYRETWNHPPTKHTLANVPNLMILDDHDIRDDWGDRQEDSKPLGLPFYIACCFYNVYNEYQRNLYEDYVSVRNAYDCTKLAGAHHVHVFGDVGILFTDTRACKSFHRQYDDEAGEDKLPLLGKRQWRDLNRLFSPGGEIENCRMLYVISPQPPCYIGEGPTMFIASLSRFFDDLYGAWSATKHVPEASLFLQMLFDWRAKRPGFREIALVAGDVHQGGYTDVVDLRFKRTERRVDRIKQITSSAISNSVTKMHEDLILHLSRTVVNSLGKWHQFYHFNWTGMRNFNVIESFLDYDFDKEPITMFSSQMFGASNRQRKAFKPVLSTARAPLMPACWGRPHEDDRTNFEEFLAHGDSLPPSVYSGTSGCATATPREKDPTYGAVTAVELMGA